MKITGADGKTRCEVGGCKRRADYVISTERTGIRSVIRVCRGCMSELYSLIGGALVPKSIETIKKREDNQWT